MVVQSQSRPSSYLWILLACLAAIGPAISLRESLWVDELHTSWTVLGDWSQLVWRAAQGNQSPLYFDAVKLLDAIIGHGEVSLRLGSLIAWIVLAAVLIRRGGRGSTPAWALQLCVGLWLALDSTMRFYGSEARPYAAVALACYMLLVQSRVNPDARVRLRIGWLVCSWLAFYLHYTAALVVFAAWLGRGVSIFLSEPSAQQNRLAQRHATEEVTEPSITAERSQVRGQRNTWPIKQSCLLLAEGLLFVVGCLPVAGQLKILSAHRGQWSSFAGNGDWYTWLQLFPWIPWLVIPWIAWIVFRVTYRQRAMSSSSNRSNAELAADTAIIANTSTKEKTSDSSRGADDERNKTATAMRDRDIRDTDISDTGIHDQNIHNLNMREPGMVVLVCVALVPSLTALILTYFEIAPLMHRRFLIGSYPAIVLIGIQAIKRMHCPKRALIIACTAAAGLVYQQETWRSWDSYTITQPQRDEDWRSAVRWLNDAANPDALIGLVPNLVETQGDTLPSTLSNDYLLFPLKGLYRIDDSFSVRPLPTIPSSTWDDALLAISEPELRIVWVILRLDKERADATWRAFQQRARNVVDGSVELVERKSFGGVTVWKLSMRRDSR